MDNTTLGDVVPSLSTTALSQTTTPDEVVEMHPGGLVLLAIIALYGTVGNIFIIGAVSLQQKLRVRGNAFVVNLAVADLIVCAYLMPLSLASSQFEQEPFGSVLCDINALLLMTSCGVSTQTLMMIAIERYCHVCKVNVYRRFFTPTFIAIYIVVVWVYTIVWTCHGLTGWSRFVYSNDVWLCVVDASYSVSYNVCLVIFGMLLPMIVLSFCYFMIFRMVYKTRKRLKHHRQKLAKNHPNSKRTRAEDRKERKEFRLIVMLFTIVIVFVVFWTPAAIVMTFSYPWRSMPDVLYTISIWMALTNSALNSIVYGAMNQNFRIGYLMFFNKIFCFCANEDKKLKCTWCKKFGKRDRDDSTTASQTAGNSKTDNTQASGHTTTTNSKRGAHKKSNMAASTTKSNMADTSGHNSNHNVTLSGEKMPNTTNSIDENKRPVTARSVGSLLTARDIAMVPIRSDSKISLRSQHSIGSVDDHLISVENAGEGVIQESALIRAINDTMDTALGMITGEADQAEKPATSGGWDDGSGEAFIKETSNVGSNKTKENSSGKENGQSNWKKIKRSIISSRTTPILDTKDPELRSQNASASSRRIRAQINSKPNPSSSSNSISVTGNTASPVSVSSISPTDTPTGVNHEHQAPPALGGRARRLMLRDARVSATSTPMSPPSSAASGRGLSTGAAGNGRGMGGANIGGAGSNTPDMMYPIYEI